MSTITHVSLGELFDDPHNPRTDRTSAIEDLVASIRELGLLTPLTVRHDVVWAGAGKKKNGVAAYRVVDGHRRLAALRQIGDDNAQIPVLVVESGDEVMTKARALAGNTVRLPLHPIDQYEAFASMQASGATVAHTAKLFGLTEKNVRQMLALGNLHPTIREAWRSEKLKSDEAKAYTLTNDQPAQLKVYEAMEQKRKKQGWGGTYWDIRRAIVGETDGNIARYYGAIGRDAYEKAGGTFVEDLFAEGMPEPKDAELVTKLYQDAWHEAAKKISGAGFTLQGFDWGTMEHMHLDISDKDQETLNGASFAKQLKLICKLIPEDKRADVFFDLRPGENTIYIDGPWKMRAGETAKVRDMERINGKLDQHEDQVPLEGEEEDAGNNSFIVSNALADDMWKWIDLAYQAAFAADPNALLRLFIACATGTYGTPMTFLQVNFQNVRDLTTKWHERIPAFGPGYDQHNLLSEFTETYSIMVRPSLDRKNLHRVAALLDPEQLVFWLRHHFQAEEFFQRATKAVALECLRQTGGNNLHAACKKKDFADAAVSRTKKKGWLPPLFKIGLPEEATALIKESKAA